MPGNFDRAEHAQTGPIATARILDVLLAWKIALDLLLTVRRGPSRDLRLCGMCWLGQYGHQQEADNSDRFHFLLDSLCFFSVFSVPLWFVFPLSSRSPEARR